MSIINIEDKVTLGKNYRRGCDEFTGTDLAQYYDLIAKTHIDIRLQSDSFPSGEPLHQDRLGKLNFLAYENCILVYLYEGLVYNEWQKYGLPEAMPYAGLSDTILFLSTWWRKPIAVYYKENRKGYVLVGDPAKVYMSSYQWYMKRKGVTIIKCPKMVFRVLRQDLDPSIEKALRTGNP